MESIPSSIWKQGGLTEHLGGVSATRRLLARFNLAPGQRILDLGCGTGWTACYLAQRHGAQVSALDLSPRSVAEARKRVSREGAEGQVGVVLADAHHLPFEADSFDAVIVESVLVFCDAIVAAQEAHRVLKPGGVLGANEFTFLKPPPAELTALLTGSLGIRAFQQEEWAAILTRAGFAQVASSVHRINMWEQMKSHMEADGVRRYLSGMRAGIRGASVRAAFFNRRMLAAARQFLPYVGYGLYTAMKE